MQLLLTSLFITFTLAAKVDDGLGRSFGIIYPRGDPPNYLDKTTRLASIVDSKQNKTRDNSNFKPIPSNSSSYQSGDKNDTDLLSQLTTIISRIGIIEGFNLSQLDMNDIQNNVDLNFILTHSLELIIAQGIQATLLHDTKYNISALFNVAKKDDKSTEYEVDLELETVDNFIVNVTFLTSYQLDTKTWKTLSFDFAFADEETGSIIEVNWNEESGAFIIIQTNLTDIVEQNIPMLNSTVNELNMSQYLSIGGYSVMETDKLAEDPIIKVLMDMGAQYVAELGVYSGVLANSTYDVSNINNIHHQKGSLYRYDVDIGDGVSNVRVNYEVYYDEKSGEAEVQTFGFHMIRNG